MPPFDLASYATENAVDLEPVAHYPVIPTGSLVIDLLTGIGGLPRGRVVEAFGPQHSGKSTAFYQAIGQCQRMGGIGLILDYENAWTAAYAQALGCSTEPGELLVETPQSIEEGFDLARRVTQAAGKAGKPLVVVFDSLALMRLAKERTEQVGDNNMIGAQRAKAVSDYFAVVTGDIARAGAVWAFVNHEKVVIQTGWAPVGSPTHRTPGGVSVAYVASIRFRFAVTKQIKGPIIDVVTGEVVEGVVAMKVSVTTPKNKLSAGNRRVEGFIRYGAGFDNSYSLLVAGLARGLIPKTGNTHEINGEKYVGAAKAIEGLRAHPEFAAQIEAEIRRSAEVAWAATTTDPVFDTEESVP